jgi:RNA polymerase sigma-70 factor (ECF subfamily)
MRPRVLAFARRRLGDRDAAEDFANEALALTIEALRDGRLGDPDEAGGWVLATCRNLLRNETRKRARRAQLAAVAQAGPPPSIAPLEPTDPWLRLAFCLAKLRERSRHVLLLSYAHDLDSREIGERMGMSAVAVRAARKRAVDALRTCLGGDRHA